MAWLQSAGAEVWVKFLLALVGLGLAFGAALLSTASGEAGNVWASVMLASLALLMAAFVGLVTVPYLARRVAIERLRQTFHYEVTKAGVVYVLVTLVIGIAALNTGNNLLFLILASLIAVILMSGVLSSITLSGVEMRLQLPGHIFAGQPVRSLVEVHDEKLTLPSFSLRVEAVRPKTSAHAAMLETPVYFPYIPKHDRVQQHVPMTFPRRGIYSQEAFRIVTRFPFGFLQKARRIDLKSEALVYPSVEPTRDFFEVLPGMQGALESLAKGRGQDLYALRDYQPRDSSRHVHWKASARLGSLMVREFTREDDCRVILVLDPHTSPGLAAKEADARFERAVTMCAALAWHFYEGNAILQFRTAGFETPLVEAEEISFDTLRHLATAKPCPPDPQRALLSELANSPEIFRVIVTSESRGTIPSNIWNQSWVIFLEDLGP